MLFVYMKYQVTISTDLQTYFKQNALNVSNVVAAAASQPACLPGAAFVICRCAGGPFPLSPNVWNILCNELQRTNQLQLQTSLNEMENAMKFKRRRRRERRNTRRIDSKWAVTFSIIFNCTIKVSKTCFLLLFVLKSGICCGFADGFFPLPRVTSRSRHRLCGLRVG